MFGKINKKKVRKVLVCMLYICLCFYLFTKEIQFFKFIKFFSYPILLMFNLFTPVSFNTLTIQWKNNYHLIDPVCAGYRQILLFLGISILSHKDWKIRIPLFILILYIANFIRIFLTLPEYFYIFINNCLFFIFLFTKFNFYNITKRSKFLKYLSSKFVNFTRRV